MLEMPDILLAQPVEVVPNYRKQQQVVSKD
jgi:hypothetical protein